jgi:hypothetical protein
MVSPTLLQVVQFLGLAVGIVFSAYLAGSFLLTAGYKPKTADEPATNVRLVIVTVADERVRNALMRTIAHTLSKFPSYELYCVLDERSALESELQAMDGLSAVVVPVDYDCEAVAKGRAIQYFTETVVDPEPEFWYGFIDDDNWILDNRFLYEIPYYEARGYRAMNPVLKPRRGESALTYVADHIRFVDDISIYRLCSGVLGRPYLGFHGELLCVRGDVLSTVGFDRDTIVEDFAFAQKLVRDRTKVWQSATRVSILSPHNVASFLEQRARWYWGVNQYLWQAPVISRILVGVRMVTWTVAITSSWVFIPLWVLTPAISLPVWVLALSILGSMLYIGTIGIGAAKVGGVHGLALMCLVPVYATLEHIIPFYSLWKRPAEFVVIDK